MSEPYELRPMAGSSDDEPGILIRHSRAYKRAAAWWAKQFVAKGGGGFILFGPLVFLFIAFVIVKYTLWLGGALVLLVAWLLTMVWDVLYTTVRYLVLPRGRK